MRDAGIASRRQAEEMIRDGRVTLNGALVRQPGQLADPDRDHIKVDGKLLRSPTGPKRYYLFNKPQHVVSTFRDPQDRPSLADYIRGPRKGLFAVGRLDFDAEGLMILTDDGAFAQSLSHPSHEVSRTYVVKVKGVPDQTDLARIRPGMPIGYGDRVGKIQVSVIKAQKTSTWLKFVLYEGKKNEIKRICSRIGHPVRKIRRIAFGAFSLGRLRPGHMRALSASEVQQAGHESSHPDPGQKARGS